MRARMHAQRRIQVEHDRLDLQEIGGRRARVAVAAFVLKRNGRRGDGDGGFGAGKWHGGGNPSRTSLRIRSAWCTPKT